MHDILQNIVQSISLLFLFIGTGIYAQTNVVEVSNLEEQIEETSGLIYLDGRLITHNDSGNSAELFEIDPMDGRILRTVTITNAENTDWEDLAQDEDYIYIGDFGNFNGNRRDLRIYRISKTDYISSDDVIAETISFSYEDQSDFANMSNSDWDAEAFFVFENTLIILTKQWESAGTVAYKLPKTSGNYVAERLDSYQVEGLITGATYSDIQQRLVLVGYSRLLLPFFVEITGLSDSAIFSGVVSKSSFNLGIAQVESIAHFENTYFFTSEKYVNSSFQIESPSRLFFLSLNQK